MPVRKIPKNHQNITGQISSLKSIGPAAFESSLERDFLIILDFNCFVEKFEVQPCRVEYYDENNKKRSYTPDVLVSYNSSNSAKEKKLLYEVKYRDDLRKNWHIFKPKFAAAYAFALSKGWNFKLITEREIRQPYLENAKFLKRYNTPIEDSRLSMAHKIMNDLRETDPETLIAALASDFSNRAEVIYLVWQMLARGYINTDFTQTLNMKSKIWCP